MSATKTHLRYFASLALPSAALLALAGCSQVESASTDDEKTNPLDKTTIYGAYHNFASAQELVGSSDAILQGKIIDSRYEAMYPLPPSTDDFRISPQAGMTEEQLAQLDPVATTVFTMSVDDVIAGDESRREVEIMQLGGVLDGVNYVSSSPVLSVSPDREVVLVLAELKSGYFDLPNPDQSAFVVREGDAITPIGKKNTLDVETVSELKALAENPVKESS